MDKTKKKAQTAIISFRLTPSLRDEIDAYMDQFMVNNPGVAISRADAVRILIQMGLAAA